jgi:hypothetical protein
MVTNLCQRPDDITECANHVPLDPGHCLLLRPGVHNDVPTTAVTPLEIDASTGEELNLRIYGFATRYIFAANQPTDQCSRISKERSQACGPADTNATADGDRR